MSALPGPYVLILLGATFVLSALWAAVLMVLVGLPSSETEGRSGASGRSHLGVELVWAVIPALIVLAIVVPVLHAPAAGAPAPAPETATAVQGNAGP